MNFVFLYYFLPFVFIITRHDNPSSPAAFQTSHRRRRKVIARPFTIRTYNSWTCRNGDKTFPSAHSACQGLNGPGAPTVCTAHVGCLHLDHPSSPADTTRRQMGHYPERVFPLTATEGALNIFHVHFLLTFAFKTIIAIWT